MADATTHLKTLAHIQSPTTMQTDMICANCGQPIFEYLTELGMPMEIYHGWKNANGMYSFLCGDGTELVIRDDVDSAAVKESK